MAQTQATVNDTSVSTTSNDFTNIDINMEVASSKKKSTISNNQNTNQMAEQYNFSDEVDSGNSSDDEVLDQDMGGYQDTDANMRSAKLRVNSTADIPTTTSVNTGSPASGIGSNTNKAAPAAPSSAVNDAAPHDDQKAAEHSQRMFVDVDGTKVPVTNEVFLLVENEYKLDDIENKKVLIKPTLQRTQFRY